MRCKAREEQDRTWAIVSRAVAKIEADQARPKAWQRRGTKSMGGCDRRSEAREGYGRMMPKDMAELDQGRTDLQVAAQRLVMKLSLENAVITCYGTLAES